MSDIPKSERSESPLRAQHLVYNIRKRITAELMATFGYSQKRFEKHIKAVTAYVTMESGRSWPKGSANRRKTSIYGSSSRNGPGCSPSARTSAST